MSIESLVVGKLVAETAKSGLSLANDLAIAKNGRITRFIQAYAPISVANWVEQHRLRITQIKAQEDIFNDMCHAMVASYKKRAQRLVSSKNRLQNSSIQTAIAEMESDLRLLNTIRMAVSLCPATRNDKTSEHKFDENHNQTDMTWWDTMESLARRYNEAWRTELLAKAMIEYDIEPGCFRLKSLWEIGMMESDDFKLLSAFCDSALYIDGKAMILLSPPEMAKFRFEDGDGLREVNLAYAVSSLISTGLIDQSSVQFSTSEPVFLEHQSGPTTFFHHYSGLKNEQGETAIQTDGFSATDIAMDICRLYTPKHNIASDANFEIFRDMMTEESIKNPESMGKVAFKTERKKS